MVAIATLCAGQGAFQAQYPNLMEHAFKVTQSMSAGALSVAAVFGIFVVAIAERYSALKGPKALFTMCAFLSVAVVNILLGFGFFPTAIAAFIACALVIIYLQGITVTDMCSPAIASRLSSVGAGYTQGMMMFFISIGFAAGSGISGFAVDAFGWNGLILTISGLTGIACAVISGIRIR